MRVHETWQYSLSCKHQSSPALHLYVGMKGAHTLASFSMGHGENPFVSNETMKANALVPRLEAKRADEFVLTKRASFITGLQGPNNQCSLKPVFAPNS